jgi:hypothetical protein
MPIRLDPEDFRTTPPQTEDSAERGFVKLDRATHDPVSYRDLGVAHAPEDRDIGDIADEGPGHRG